MSKLEVQWTKFDTPATKFTREIGFVVSVDADAEWIGTSTMPIEGTTYGASPIQPKPNADKLDYEGVAYSAYVCTKITSGTRWSFYFGKPKTEAQKNTPYRIFTRTEHYPWEAVLEDYHAEADFRSALEMRDSAGDTFYQQRWNSRFHLRPAIQGASVIEYRLYLSPTKFTNLGRPIIQQPVYVNNGFLPGDTSQPIGSVLIAKRIRVPTLVLGPVALKYQTYDPTIPNGRARHLIDDDQDQNSSGMWERLEKYANPPFGQTRITDK